MKQRRVIETVFTVIVGSLAFTALAWFGDSLKERLPKVLSGDTDTMSQSNIPKGFMDLFTQVPSSQLKMPSRYFGQVQDMPANTPEKTVLEVQLDPSVSPVWTIVVLARPIGGAPLDAFSTLWLVATYGVGRLYISGGSGGGVVAQPIPFDTKIATYLTVPASLVRVTIDTTPIRIPGTVIRGQGTYSAYAVPFAIGKGEGAVFTGFTDTIAPGATGMPVIDGLVPTLVDSVTVLPMAVGTGGILPVANLGPFSVLIGPTAIQNTEWSFPGAPNAQMPLWMPVQAGAEGTVSVRNDSGAPARYAVIYRLRA